MSWSLDSARLAYDVSGTAQTQFGVAVVPAAGGPVARLVEGLGRPGRPDWSPLGALAFSDGDVRTIDADGTAPSRLVGGGPGIQSDPRWSPAGDRIVFVTESERSSFPEVGSYLEVADPDGGGRIRITPESPRPCKESSRPRASGRPIAWASPPSRCIRSPFVAAGRSRRVSSSRAC